MNIRNYTVILFFSVFLFATTSPVFSQQKGDIELNVSIKSVALNETRTILIKLPRDYHKSDKSYPVLYRLDGNHHLLAETDGAISRLLYVEELIPEMIVVMIGNTRRDRDMLPVKTSFFKSEPGAVRFKKFIKKELIPYIDRSYRTTDKKLLCGQSLSAIFTIYCYLSDPYMFNSYIACSPGFPDCEQYFIKLSNNFLNKKYKKRSCIFLTYGAKDFLDPDGSVKKQLLNFTQTIRKSKSVQCELRIYQEEGHVPFQSLYHGLKFIYKSEKQDHE